MLTFFQRVLDYALRQFQGMAWYRKLMRRRPPGFYILEAGASDLAKASAAFNIVVAPIADPRVTNYVARRKQTIAGFVQLLRNSEENFPCGGYWLSGLMVSSRWRGFGIGTALTRRVMEQAVREGAPELFCVFFRIILLPRIFMTTWASRPPAFRPWKSKGNKRSRTKAGAGCCCARPCHDRHDIAPAGM